MVREVQVADREQVLARQVGPPAAVGKVVGQPAGLAAGTAVAAAPGHRAREETPPAVADADGPVDETFDLGLCRGTDGTDLIERKVALEDHPRKARLAQEASPFGRAVRDLRRGVQFDRKVHPPQGHVLHDQRVDARGDQLAGLTLGIGQFVVPQQRVERGMDPHAVAVGILHRTGDLLRGVPGRLTRPEARPADVDGIGAVVHGRNDRVVILGRGQQLDAPAFSVSDQALFHQETKVRFFTEFPAPQGKFVPSGRLAARCCTAHRHTPKTRAPRFFRAARCNIAVKCLFLHLETEYPKEDRYHAYTEANPR